ncbi:MAG TPA: hypothetical protein VGL81_23600 [Polyangiaceae bacterium]|jgi:hypothetical protein
MASHTLARRALAVAVAAVALLAAGRAHAWQEAHQTGDDVVVRVDPAGTAEIQHAIRWHVVRGPLKSIDVVHVDPAVTLEPDVPILTEDGRSLLAHASRRDDRTVRITIDEPRALMRGNFTFDLRGRVDLVSSHALARDGATWRLVWSSPVANDGFDAAHTVFDLPAAPDPPQPILADTGAVDDGAVSALRREPGRDRLELVRPHVSRGESPVWTVRVDPRALPDVSDPRLRPPAEAAVAPEPDRVREASMAVGLAALALLFGLCVGRKARVFAAACTARGATSRALLPIPDAARAALAGIALSGGVALELSARATAGAACIAVATLAAALRAPSFRPAARGPGRWLAFRPEEAFAPGPSTWTGDALAAVLALAGVVAVAVLGRRFDAEAPWLVALDASVLVPLFVTGRPSQLPPDGARTAAPWLARVHAALRAVPQLRVRPWARVPLEGTSPDELRLLVLPRAALPGLLGIELGLAWSCSPVGWSSTPEVLTRVVEGSPAAARLAQELPAMRLVPGRRPDERVVRLLPRAPTRAAAAALARTLSETFTDRRVAVPAGGWAAPERRKPRPRPPVAAAEAAA